ncbi:MAG: sensor histidine kinase [Chloroflexi bacterium]|nr:sensor histidine kinase [Chloroflexota bacterium]MBU1746998.1 sensor histidine kinase [Chloroflexota bacterium]MBU1878541.1 sensor histidine kinase [Chloroflexota bacterium]
MSTTAHRRLNLGPIGDVLFAVLVVIDLVSAFTLPAGLLDLGGYVVLAAASLAYLFLGIYGWKTWERSRSPRVARAYFAVQVALGAFIVYWGYGSAWLLLLPLASQSIELPRRGTLLVCLLLVGTIALPGLLPERLLASGLVPPDELASTVFLGALEFATAMAFVLLFSEVVVRERQARAALDEAHHRLGEYAVQVADLATVQERNRLAREIHDSLGHHLTAIHVHLEATRALYESQPALALNALDKAQALTQEGLTEVRRSVAALRASPLEGRSLPEALASVVDECRRAGLPTELVVTGEVRPLSPPATEALFRAVQEGLTNARKHAQATRAEVIADYTEAAMVRLTVRDDGVGASETAATGAGGGFGLVGVRERVHLLGGQVQVHTAPGQGFALIVEVPG